MTEDPYVEVSYSFRMSLKSYKYIEDFQRLLPNQKIDIGSLFSDRSKPVIVIEINESIDINIINQFLLEHKPGIIKHDFFISMVISYYEYSIDLPNYFIEAIRKLGGTVSFSYTSVCIEQDL